MNIDLGPTSEIVSSHDEAWLYCACLYHNGYSDWRLSNRKEYSNLNIIYGWWQGSARNNLPNVTMPVRDL